MKGPIISFQTKRLLKQRIRQSSLSYLHAKCVGILINGDIEWQGLDQFLSELNRDHDEIHTLHYYAAGNPVNGAEACFSPKDFNLLGQSKSDAVSNFTTPKFDYLFVLEKQPSLFVDFVTLKANSKTNIGFYYDEGNAIADLQIKPDHGRELDDLLRYARQLS